MDDHDARSAMLAINARQKAYYERVRQSDSHDYSGGSMATKVWAHVRSRLWAFQADVGARDRAITLHRQYLGDVSDRRVLDLGVGGGSALTMWLAEHAGEYVGIDLAETPVRALNERFRDEGYATARAEVMDFLANDFPAERFDVIYAYAVLHHFRDADVLLDELHRVLAPGGMILSYDPLATEPLNRLARRAYRRWQVDRDWEWPFTRATLATIADRFEVVAVQGVLGRSKWGMPLYLVPGVQGIGRAIARRGVAHDGAHATSIGPALYGCWQVALVLRKRDH